MRLEERMKRNSNEDQIEIGLVAEGLAQGNQGELLKMLIAGIEKEAKMRKVSDTSYSAEEALGILIGVDLLTERIDQCVDIKNQLVAEKKAEAQTTGSPGGAGGGVEV